LLFLIALILKQIYNKFEICIDFFRKVDIIKIRFYKIFRKLKGGTEMEKKRFNGVELGFTKPYVFNGNSFGLVEKNENTVPTQEEMQKKQVELENKHINETALTTGRSPEEVKELNDIAEEIAGSLYMSRY
jgi:hypothetical protein